MRNSNKGTNFEKFCDYLVEIAPEIKVTIKF